MAQFGLGVSWTYVIHPRSRGDMGGDEMAIATTRGQQTAYRVPCLLCKGQGHTRKHAIISFSPCPLHKPPYVDSSTPLSLRMSKSLDSPPPPRPICSSGVRWSLGFSHGFKFQCSLFVILFFCVVFNAALKLFPISK